MYEFIMSIASQTACPAPTHFLLVLSKANYHKVYLTWECCLQASSLPMFLHKSTYTCILMIHSWVYTCTSTSCHFPLCFTLIQREDLILLDYIMANNNICIAILIRLLLVGC